MDCLEDITNEYAALAGRTQRRIYRFILVLVVRLAPYLGCAARRDRLEWEGQTSRDVVHCVSRLSLGLIGNPTERVVGITTGH